MLQLSFRYYLCLSLLTCGLNAAIQPEARCATAASSGDIFSTPDTHVAPTFMGRVQTNPPASSTFLFPDPPDREALLAIPSITSDQRNKINNLFQQEGSETRILQGQIDSLNRILNERKATKQRMTAIQAANQSMDQSNQAMNQTMMDADFSGEFANYNSDSDDSIKAHIESVKQQMKAARMTLWQNCQSLLDPNQMFQLQTMQHGQLFIASNASTDVPEPLPPIKPPPARPAPYPGFPPQRPPYGIGYQPTPKTMLLNSTKQLLNRVLWGR